MIPNLLIYFSSKWVIQFWKWGDPKLKHGVIQNWKNWWSNCVSSFASDSAFNVAPICVRTVLWLKQLDQNWRRFWITTFFFMIYGEPWAVLRTPGHDPPKFFNPFSTWCVLAWIGLFHLWILLEPQPVLGGVHVTTVWSVRHVNITSC